jgi:hypothetical protein
MCDFLLVIAEFEYGAVIAEHLQKFAGFEADQLAILDIDDDYLPQSLEKKLSSLGEGTVGAAIQFSPSAPARYSPISLLLRHARGLRSEHMLVVLNKASKQNPASQNSKIITTCIEHDIRFTTFPLKPKDSSFAAFIRNCAPYSYMRGNSFPKNVAASPKGLKTSASSVDVVREDMLNLQPQQQTLGNKRHTSSLPSLSDSALEPRDGFAQDNPTHTYPASVASQKRGKRGFKHEPKSNESIDMMQFDQVKLVMGSTGSVNNNRPWNDRHHVESEKKGRREKGGGRRHRLNDNLLHKGGAQNGQVPKFSKKPLPKRKKMQKRCEQEALRISRAVDDLESESRGDLQDALEILRVCATFTKHISCQC